MDLCFKSLTSLSPFEYLAATGAGRTTDTPGPSSFTSALIYALKNLLEEKTRFTSTDLARKIKDEAPDFPKHQEPILTDRRAGSHVGRICLQPMVKIADSTGPEQHDSMTPESNSAKSVLTLHFDLDAVPQKDQIEELGKSLNRVMTEYRLPISRIRWGGWRPSVFTVVVDRLKLLHRRSRSRNSPPELNLQNIQQLQKEDQSRQPSLAVETPFLTPTSDRFNNRDSAGLSPPSSTSSVGESPETVMNDTGKYVERENEQSPIIAILEALD